MSDTEGEGGAFIAIISLLLIIICIILFILWRTNRCIFMNVYMKSNSVEIPKEKINNFNQTMQRMDLLCLRRLFSIFRVFHHPSTSPLTRTRTRTLYIIHYRAINTISFILQPIEDKKKQKQLQQQQTQQWPPLSHRHTHKWL